MINDDRATLYLIETVLASLYRALINERRQPGNMRISADYSKYHYEYNQHGILVPVRVNSTKNIDSSGILFMYVFIITNFYEAMLFYIKHEETPNNENNLRCVYYLNKMILSKTDVQLDNSEFLKVFSRIFGLVQIDIDSILITCIDREMNCDIHGDVRVTNNNTGNTNDFSFGYGSLKSYNSRDYSIHIGPNVDQVIDMESMAIYGKYLANNNWKDLVKKNGNTIVIISKGDADLFTKIFVAKLVNTRPMVVLGVHDGDKDGYGIFHRLKCGVL